MKECMFDGNKPGGCPFWNHGCIEHDLDKCKLKRR